MSNEADGNRTTLRRTTRFLNIILAVLSISLAVAIYWYAYRPLPQTAGTIDLPVSGPASVERDARGVPHIQAATWQDALFLQGYVTAQDRLWQMDSLRRFAAGELAEVFGPAAVPTDTRARQLQMRNTAIKDVAALTPSEKEVFTAYARGVDYFIRTHRGDYSLEFSLPGHQYDPRPWGVVDSVLAGLVIFRDLTDSSEFEMKRAAMIWQARDQARMRLLFPPVMGGYVNPGSNAWAVSGALTADGKPMLANDPHLAYSIPPTWYLVHLKASGLNVSGASLPGVPGVLTGHNEHIAWGITALESSCMDIYRERIDLRSGRYEFRGQVLQAQPDVQYIGVRGAKPAVVSTWVTQHGPVISAGKTGAYALRWTAYDGLSFPFFDIDRANNWQEFRNATARLYGPPLNFVYADGAGNIGYQVAGRVPVRHGFDSEIPVDGASGQNEWNGYIPPDQLPSIYNPPSGMVVTANQNPFPSGYAYTVPGNFHGPYRALQIQALLQKNPKLDVDAMLRIQKDVYSEYDLYLAHAVIAAAAQYPSHDAAISEAVAVLSRWNGQMELSEAAPVITQLLSQALAQRLVASAGANANPGPNSLQPRPETIESLLRGRPAGWVPKNDWDRLLLDALQSALGQGTARQGSRVAKWRWGHILQWNLQHPVGRQLPLVSAYFNIGPVEMSGSSTTVKQTLPTLGPSERMVVDFGNLDNSVQNLTVGESGFVASSHYKDQWLAYYNGFSYPMEFNKVDAKKVLQVRPRTPNP